MEKVDEWNLKSCIIKKDNNKNIPIRILLYESDIDILRKKLIEDLEVYMHNPSISDTQKWIIDDLIKIINIRFGVEK